MEKKKLFITVSGTTKSGKSRLCYLLKKFLKEQEFDVEFDGDLDHPDEENFDRFMGQNFDKAIENIRETNKIIIRETQLTSYKE